MDSIVDLIERRAGRFIEMPVYERTPKKVKNQIQKKKFKGGKINCPSKK